MEFPRIMRVIAVFLIAILGVVYLVLALFFSSFVESMEIAPALFVIIGVIYLVIAVGLFGGKRLFNYLGAVVPLAWASMGLIHYTVKPDPIVFPFIVVEIIIILCCCYIILQGRTSQSE